MLASATWLLLPTVLAISIAGAGLMAATAQDAASVETTLLNLPLPTEVEELIVLSEMRPKGRGNYLGIIAREAKRLGLPTAVADAVAQVESGYDPAAIGTVGEVGLMQMRPPTAALLGHKGPSSDLFAPETNIRLGVAYLAQAWRVARGDLCRALMKYRAGLGEERMTRRSVDYCVRARAHLASVGSALALAPVPGLAEVSRRDSSPQPRPPAPLSLAQSSNQSAAVRRHGVPPPVPDIMRRLWAEHAARVRALEARIDRVMSGG